MNRNTRQPWGAVLGIPLLAAGCAVAQPAARLDRDVALETFDAAWRIVHETHYDTTFNGVDWEALRDTLRPQAKTAETSAALRAVIRRMLGRLEQSHFSLIPQEAADRFGQDDETSTDRVGDLGFDVRLLDDDVVVVQVDSGGPAAAAGVRPGWALVAVGKDSVSEMLARVRDSGSRYPDGFRLWNRVLAALQGETGDTVTVTLLNDVDRRVTHTLTRRRAPGQPVKFGDLPAAFSEFASRRVASTEHEVEIGVIWFNYWMVPLVRQVDSALHAYRELDGIVMDLRGNRGGVGAMVLGVAGHFLDEQLSLGTFQSRTTTLRMRANPRRVSPEGRRVEPFAGPVAVLTDEGSASASEMFAGGMQAIDRVRVFGDTTLGAVLPARTSRLPNGDVLYHAFADFTTADGVRLEGRGVIPDEVVVPSRGDYLAGRDPVLESAIRWIGTERRRSATQTPN